MRLPKYPRRHRRRPAHLAAGVGRVQLGKTARASKVPIVVNATRLALSLAHVAMTMRSSVLMGRPVRTMAVGPSSRFMHVSVMPNVINTTTAAQTSKSLATPPILGILVLTQTPTLGEVSAAWSQEHPDDKNHYITFDEEDLIARLPHAQDQAEECKEECLRWAFGLKQGALLLHSSNTSRIKLLMSSKIQERRCANYHGDNRVQ
eukprot:g4315.t1